MTATLVSDPMTEVPTGPHWAILERAKLKESPAAVFFYTVHTDYAEYVKELAERVAVCGAGKVFGLSVNSRAEVVGAPLIDTGTF